VTEVTSHCVAGRNAYSQNVNKTALDLAFTPFWRGNNTERLPEPQ